MTGPGAEGGHWLGWAGQKEAAGPRGSLRIYLGFAPGAGATCALLNEGGQWAERGADVVIACADTRGRPYTAGLLAGLPELAGPVRPGPAPAAVPLDLGRVLARAPQVALVDDLAQVNPAGSAHPARWHEVEELLAAGIDVIATVRLASLESLSDVAETITGEPAGDTVPDGVVRAADEIELVDVTPEVLRERMARGEIYPLPQAQVALAGPFRAGNLSALRELALLWLVSKLAEDPQRHRPGGYRSRTGQARERVVAGVGGGPGSPALIRRAARLAARSSGELLAVHVVRLVRRADGDPATLSTLRHVRLAALRPRASVTAQTLRRCTGPDVHIVRDGSIHNDKKPGRQLPRRFTSARNALIPARVFTARAGLLGRVRETLSTFGGVPPAPVSRQHLQ
jgi:two-component system sensor histidine kinase KdpD